MAPEEIADLEDVSITIAKVTSKNYCGSVFDLYVNVFDVPCLTGMSIFNVSNILEGVPFGEYAEKELDLEYTGSEFSFEQYIDEYMMEKDHLDELGGMWESINEMNVSMASQCDEYNIRFKCIRARANGSL